MADNTFLRVVHDLSQAAWFGGALRGAIETDTAPDPARSGWQPITNAAIAAHLAAGLGLTFANKGRITIQRGAATVTAVKTGLTVAALGMELYSRRVAGEPSELADDGSTDRQEARERASKMSRWSLVALTGAVIAVGARMGEQQRPSQLAAGISDRWLPFR